MIKKHVGRSVVTFGQIFDVFLDFVNLPYFNAISMDFYAVHLFGVISMFVCGRMLI